MRTHYFTTAGLATVGFSTEDDDGTELSALATEGVTETLPGRYTVDVAEGVTVNWYEGSTFIVSERVGDSALTATRLAKIDGMLASAPGATARLYELGEDRDGDGLADRNVDGSLKYPIAGVRVYLTAVNNPDAPIVWDGITDAAGRCVPLVVDGTYYHWRFKAGVAFVNPDVETYTTP